MITEVTCSDCGKRVLRKIREDQIMVCGGCGSQNLDW